MPVFHDITLTLDMQQVLRPQGIGGRSKLRPELKAVLQNLLSDMKEIQLLKPAIAYEIYLRHWAGYANLDAG